MVGDVEVASHHFINADYLFSLKRDLKFETSYPVFRQNRFS